MDAISHALAVVRDKLKKTAYRLDEPMKNHTSFKVGGVVRSVLFPRSARDFAELCGLLHEHGIRTLIIGNGTNVLINDVLGDMVVIRTIGLYSAKLISENKISAGAGMSLTQLAGFAYANGLTGLEFAYGIPGTVGGAVLMNAGAYGSEMKDIVHSTAAYSPDGGMATITGEQHGFSYRNSRFSDTGDIVVSTEIVLQKGDAHSIREKMDEFDARRRESQPLEKPSAGSTFKRPKDGYAAALIEQAGLKGCAIGDAQVSEKHAGFIINRGEASFKDIMRLIGHVQETVFKQFGVELEPEVKIIR